MQVARRLPHRLLAPAVVAGRGVWIGVPRELMHRREVAYGVQQVAPMASSRSPKNVFLKSWGRLAT